MSTVIGWRSFVKIRASVFIVGVGGMFAWSNATWASSPGVTDASVLHCVPAAPGNIAQAPTATSSPKANATAAPPASGSTSASGPSPVRESPAEPPSERLALSLSEAVERAMAQSPSVVNAQNLIRQAEARRIGAGVILPVNPRLSADVRPLLGHAGGLQDTGYGATLDVLFDMGGAPSARVSEADREAKVAHADFVFDRAEARLRAFAAYIQTQIAELRIAEARSAMEISKRVLAAAERRVATGASSDLEAASAELDLALLQAQEASFIRERDAHLMDLRDVLDVGATVAVDLTSPVEEPPRLAAARVYVDRALSHHPTVAALQARVELLDATETRLEREVFPRVGVYAGVDAAPLSPMYGVLGASIELPFAQRNQGPRAVTAKARDGVRTRLALEARRLSRDVVAAWNAYEARRLELERLTQRAMPAAARTLSFAEAGWQAGRFDLFRLLTAARDALRLRASRIDVLEAAWIARIELERAVGEEVSS